MRAGAIHNEPGNLCLGKSAWWAGEDSNCVPGTQCYLTGLRQAFFLGKTSLTWIEDAEAFTPDTRSAVASDSG